MIEKKLDIINQPISALLLKAQNEAIQNTLTGESIENVCLPIITALEIIEPNMKVSILRLTEKDTLSLVSAPSLPDYYNDAIEGLNIGMGVGSCGESAFTGKPVIAENVFEHPNWVEFRPLIKKTGLMACWSHPIIGQNNKIFGTVAAYYKTIKKPTDQEKHLMESATKIIALAFSVVEDKVQRTEAQKTLEIAKNKAEKAAYFRSQFIANMSHEFRTPLNAILGFSETLLKQNDIVENKEKRTEYLEIVYESGKQLLSHINDVMDVAKTDQGSLEVHLEEVDLDEILLNIVSLFKYSKAKLKLQLPETNEATSKSVSIDIRLAKQALQNIISNAIKATKNGGIVEISKNSQKDGTEVIIKDFGQGMTKEEVVTALEPFGRVGNVYITNEKGTGLGLPLAKRFMEAQDGSLKIKSKKNIGTEIRLKFQNSI